MSCYLYRCPECGCPYLHKQPVTEPVAEVLPLDHCTTPSPDVPVTGCSGTLRRVWEVTNLNLGFREVKHTDNEGYLFKHLAS